MGIFSIFKRRRRPELEQKGPAGQKRRQKQQQTPSASDPAPTRQVTWRSMVVLMVMLIWGSTVFTTMQRTKPSVDFVENQSAPSNIYAEVDFDYADIPTTYRLREERAQKAPYIYRFDHSANDQIIQEFQNFLTWLNAWDPEQPPEAAAPRSYLTYGPENLQEFKAFLGVAKRQDDLLTRLRELLRQSIVSAEDINASGERQVIVVDESERARPSEIKSLLTPETAARELMKQMVQDYGTLNESARDRITRQIVEKLLLPNTKYDHQATEEAKNAARANVKDVMLSVQSDKIIVPINKKITQQDLVILQAHALAVAAAYDSDTYWRQTGAMVLLSLLTVCVWAVIMHTNLPRLTRSMSKVATIGVVVAVNILLIWAVRQGMLVMLHGAQPLVFAGLPLLFSAVMLSILLGPPAGMTAGILVAVLAAFTAGGHGAPLHVIVLGVAQSVVGALSVRSVRTRIQTFRSLVYVPVAIFLVELVFLIMSNSPWNLLAQVFGVAMVNVLVVMVLVNLLLPIAEIVFRITTNISLLELSDLNHPLLKRLQLEAPGTFHHTMNVATIAEHAAEAIGANTLLCRVASYFHDVGKLSNPAYFTENNIDQKNQHEDLNPHMSARIIVNHVKEGLELARQYKLRAPIRDAIATHHGTSLVFFFYHRAKTERAPNSARVEESSFRYPGPLPRSPECTIISIADSCEAASRSLSKPTPQKIDTLVNDIVRSRILDGQLDESELTMDELNRVVATIKRTLRTMRHARIAYPRDDGAKSNDDDDEKPGGDRPDGMDKTRKMSPDEMETKVDIEALITGKATSPDAAATPKPAVVAPAVEEPVEPVRPARPQVTPTGTTVMEFDRSPSGRASAKASAPPSAEATPAPVDPTAPPAATPAPAAPEPEPVDPTAPPEDAAAAPAPPVAAVSVGLVVNVSLTNHQTDVPVADSPLLIRLLRRCVELSDLCQEEQQDAEVSFSLVDLETIESVNQQHLQHEGPTDVITFDYRDEVTPGAPDEEETLGEVMVCPAMAIRQAPEHGQDVPTELVLYLVHGILHLSGYDDLQDADRGEMRQAEQDMLQRLREEFDFSLLFGTPTGAEPV